MLSVLQVAGKAWCHWLPMLWCPPHPSSSLTPGHTSCSPLVLFTACVFTMGSLNPLPPSSFLGKCSLNCGKLTQQGLRNWVKQILMYNGGSRKLQKLWVWKEFFSNPKAHLPFVMHRIWGSGRLRGHGRSVIKAGLELRVPGDPSSRLPLPHGMSPAFVKIR